MCLPPNLADLCTADTALSSLKIQSNVFHFRLSTWPEWELYCNYLLHCCWDLTRSLSSSHRFHDHKMVKAARNWMLLKWEGRTPTASVQQTISLLRKVPTEIIAWLIMFFFLKIIAKVTKLDFSKQTKPHQHNCKDMSVWVCIVSLLFRVSTETMLAFFSTRLKSEKLIIWGVGILWLTLPHRGKHKLCTNADVWRGKELYFLWKRTRKWQPLRFTWQCVALGAIIKPHYGFHSNKLSLHATSSEKQLQISRLTSG